MLTLHLFGSPQVWLDEQPVQIPRRKSRALLYYLAAEPGPIPREALLTFFWPDEERAAGQQVLRTSLHGLRKLLGDGLRVERDIVSLSEGSFVDALRLEQGLNDPPADPPALEALLDLYRGEFLEGFSLPDSEEFESWLTVERQHYRQLVTRGLSALSRSYEQRRNYASAVAALERALRLDPLQEDLQREVIRLLHLSGDRAAAIRRYDSLRRLLDEELGVPPMAETRALYDDILNDRLKESLPVETAPAAQAPSRPPDSAVLPFTSRESELRLLHEEIFSGRLILLEGEAGIGKTRLAEHFLGSLDATALTGAGRELEQSLPYQPVVEALRGLFNRADGLALIQAARQELAPVWLGETARLLPELDPRQPVFSADEWRLWEGISQFLQVLSRQHPLVLFLDDLHWADAPTLGLLGYLVRHTSGPRVGFLGTARPFAPRSPLANLVQALTRERRLVRHALSRFSPADIQTVSQQFSPGYAQVLSNWLEQHSEGNPYILTELLRDARRRGILTSDGVVNFNALSSEPPVPYTVYSLIESRLSGLSEATRRLLSSAAAVGRDFEYDLAARAAGLAEDSALDALDEALSVGLIHPLGEGRYRFDHSLTVEVAAQADGPERHRHMHRSVAAAMETLYRPDTLEKNPGLLAYHYQEGGDPARAAPFALKAARQAAGLGAWHEAAAFYEQSLAGIHTADRCAVLLNLGWALVRSGEAAARATEIFNEAVECAEQFQDQDLAARARIALAQSYLPQSRFGEAVAVIQRVLQENDPFLTFEGELWWGTTLSLEGSDLDEAERHLYRAAEFCKACAGPVSMAQVEFELGSIAAQKGDLEQAVQRYRQALESASHSETPEAIERRVLAYNNLAYHLLLLGDPSAEQYALSGLELAREKGVLNFQVYLYSTLGEIALSKNQLAEAEKWFHMGLEQARQMRIPERIAGLTANLGRLAKERGEINLAIHRLSSAMALADTLGTRHLAAQIRIWLAPLLPPDESQALLAEARASAESGGRRRLLDEADALTNE